MDWRLEAAAFRVFDLPGGKHVHYFMQRHEEPALARRVVGGHPF